MKRGSNYFPVAIVYDTGSQLTLCNYETGPLLISSKPADRKVTISTVNSTKAQLRRIHTLTLGDDFQLDAVLIPNLRLHLRSMDIPDVWKHLSDELADQDMVDIQAQILVGADKATIFPYCETDEDGKPMQVSSCRLMRSHLTNKLILFGACKEHEDTREARCDSMYVHHTQATTSGDEALTSGMSILAITDLDPEDEVPEQE